MRIASGGSGPAPAPVRSRIAPTAASPGRAGSSLRYLAVTTAPPGLRATTSVKVPPRSIQICQSVGGAIVGPANDDRPAVVNGGAAPAALQLPLDHRAAELGGEELDRK